MKHSYTPTATPQPPLAVALLPLGLLISSVVLILLFKGNDSISSLSAPLLLGSTMVALAGAWACGTLSARRLYEGLRHSARQTLPAVPLLLFIGLIATSWLLSGIVPVMVSYGLAVLNPSLFLCTACVVCAIVSVLTGSSWTTIATIGVAFMGVGQLMGFHAGWVAGAIISGAYFGDKVSPLSDTTIISSSSCGVELFDHIRYLMLTSIPSIVMALAVFLVAGLMHSGAAVPPSAEMVEGLRHTFNLSPWLLAVPAVVAVMIVMRVPTVVTLATGGVLGVVAMLVFQPQVVDALAGAHVAGTWQSTPAVLHAMLFESALCTGSPLLDDFVATSGIMGMVPTIVLVLSAMCFGAVMIGTGMLATLTDAITRRLHGRGPIVGSTVASGLALNACTADQYLSIIIGANVYTNIYRRASLEPRLLSRTLEDSVSVTSVLIPWNSCGVVQSSVLGVATLAYLPYCVFNLLSPLVTLIMGFAMHKIHPLQPIMLKNRQNNL